MTPLGQQALAVAKWAWEDPPGRVQTAIEQVRGMASAATGDELTEIQDAGTMLHRLAGTLDTEPVDGQDTILQQLAGDTLVSQLVDLARDAWRNERRGPHGEWVGGGGGGASKSRAARIKRLQQANARQASAAPATSDDHLRQLIREEIARATANAPAVPAENKAAEVAFQVSGRATETPREKLIHEQLIRSQVEPLAESKAAAVLEQAKQTVAEKMAAAHAEHETEEGRKRAKKLVIESGVAVLGAILAYVETKLGLPELAAILTNAAPFLIQPIVEFLKKV